MNLLNDTLLDLFDTPFDYEIVYQGNYYQEPGISLEQITWQYCVVPYNQILSIEITSQVLENLYLPSGEEITMCGKTVSKIDLEHEAFYITGNSEEFESGGDVEPNTVARIKLWREYQPQGFIRTQNTNLGDVPVRNLQVKSRRWFNIDKTMTDANGFFKISNRYRGHVHINLEFKNKNCAIRGIRGLRIWEIADAIDAHVGDFINSDIESISHLIENDGANFNSEKKRIWMATQTINALEEYMDMATNSQIMLPDDHLNIWLTTLITLNDAGSAPMLRKMANSSSLSAFADLKLIASGNPEIALVKRILQQFLPDVTYGYKHFENMNVPSDVIANTLYHEFGHTSHYRKVGNTYWGAYVLYIITNGGYGNTSKSGHQRIEISEGWAEYVSCVFAHNRYGNLASGQTFLTIIENYQPISISNNFPFDAAGTMYDLTDIGEPSTTGITDGVNLYLVKENFAAMTNGVLSVQNFHTAILSQNSNKQKTAVDVLFTDYGF